MTKVIVQHQVKDFNAWLPKFLEHGKVRTEFGCEGATVHRALDDPNNVYVLLDWSTPAAFQRFMDESDLKDRMADAGVISQPSITLVTDAAART